MQTTLILRSNAEAKQWVPSETDKDYDKKHTIIALDWDDTLLCTSWLGSMGVGLHSIPSEKALESCAQLAKSVNALIHEAQKYGDVIIVTNADEGWVQATCVAIMPMLWPLISSLKIFSAQHLHNLTTPVPHLWKKFVFRDYIWSVYGYDFNHIVNFVSIGDGLSEEYAVHSLNGIAVKGTIKGKSLRFMEKSNPEMLIRQLDLAAKNIRAVVLCKQALTLTVNVSVVAETCHAAAALSGNVISYDTSVDCD